MCLPWSLPAPNARCGCAQCPPSEVLAVPSRQHELERKQEGSAPPSRLTCICCHPTTPTGRRPWGSALFPLFKETKPGFCPAGTGSSVERTQLGRGPFSAATAGSLGPTAPCPPGVPSRPARPLGLSAIFCRPHGLEDTANCRLHQEARLLTMGGGGAVFVSV